MSFKGEIENTENPSGIKLCPSYYNNTYHCTGKHCKYNHDPKRKRTISSDSQKIYFQKHDENYKTELCRSLTIENGFCQYGEGCFFAHSIEELRIPPRLFNPKYKTKFCEKYHGPGFCNYGPKCDFVHKTDELVHETIYNPILKAIHLQTQQSQDNNNVCNESNLQLCENYHVSGYCNNGPRCDFIHNVSISNDNINVFEKTFNKTGIQNREDSFDNSKFSFLNHEIQTHVHRNDETSKFYSLDGKIQATAHHNYQTPNFYSFDDEVPMTTHDSEMLYTVPPFKDEIQSRANHSIIPNKFHPLDGVNLSRPPPPPSPPSSSITSNDYYDYSFDKSASNSNSPNIVSGLFQVNSIYKFSYENISGSGCDQSFAIQRLSMDVNAVLYNNEKQKNQFSEFKEF